MCVNRNDQGNIQPGSYPQRSDIVCIGMCIGDVTPRLVWLNIYNKRSAESTGKNPQTLIWFPSMDLIWWYIVCGWFRQKMFFEKIMDCNGSSQCKLCSASFMLQLSPLQYHHSIAAPSSKSCGAPKKEQHLLAIICLHYQTLNEIIWLEISNVCFQELRGISIKV